ncbi:MAG: hypothetical protein AAF567_01340 [Actinomycetota bacterium]
MITSTSALDRMALLLWLTVASMATMTAAAPVASADAAGPTDYRTDIVSIEPADIPISVEMIGGDAFIILEQQGSVEVVVLGYRGEEYLRFDPDGTVVENRRSPATWLNAERYGTEDALPSFVDHQAPPQWRRVASNGRYAWHDHRTHWMNPARPPGAEPGDQVLEATVPLLIDGRPVTITVASFLLEDPPVWPGLLGAVAGIALASLGLRGGRVPLSLAGILVGGLALLLGTVAFRSVPSETEPQLLLWLLPTIAFAALVIVLLVRKRLATTVYLDGLGVAAGATLAAWAIIRLDALTRSLIPSEAPATLDRIGIGAALVAGVVLAGRGLWGLARPQRLIEP